MPIFEYRCTECGTKYEVFHKSKENKNEVVCPNCHSLKNKKLLSSFSPSMGGYSSSENSCADGSCSNPYSDGCSNGLCGLN